MLRAVSGLRFHFSNTWQLIITPGTTIVTFLIQNTRNHDSEALHLKIDGLIRTDYEKLAEGSPAINRREPVHESVSEPLEPKPVCRNNLLSLCLNGPSSSS